MGVVDSGVFHHLCFVVRDIDAAARRLSESLSIGPWGVWTIEPTESSVHGEPRDFTFRVALAEAGGVNYELLMPVSGDTIYEEHLREHGDGYHHACVLYSTLDAMRAAKQELLDQGRELLQGGSVGEAVEFCYFAIPEIGSALELLYLEDLGEPEKTIA